MSWRVRWEVWCDACGAGWVSVYWLYCEHHFCEFCKALTCPDWMDDKAWDQLTRMESS